MAQIPLIKSNPKILMSKHSLKNMKNHTIHGKGLRISLEPKEGNWGSFKLGVFSYQSKPPRFFPKTMYSFMKIGIREVYFDE